MSKYVQVHLRSKDCSDYTYIFIHILYIYIDMYLYQPTTSRPVSRSTTLPGMSGSRSDLTVGPWGHGDGRSEQISQDMAAKKMVEYFQNGFEHD